MQDSVLVLLDIETHNIIPYVAAIFFLGTEPISL
jgi:hypothetical protein